jgi:hypothetical protein
MRREAGTEARSVFWVNCGMLGRTVDIDGYFGRVFARTLIRNRYNGPWADCDSEQ